MTQLNQLGLLLQIAHTQLKCLLGVAAVVEDITLVLAAEVVQPLAL